MAAGERILGIDPGSRFMGYGIIERDGSKLRYIDADRLVLGSGSLPERLLHIDTFLTQYIAKHEPDVASIEGIFHQKFADAALKLGHARGVVVCACARASLPIFEYAPTDVKLAVTAYGRAEKAQVAAMVRIILGVQNTWPLDASDALALAICHANRPRTAFSVLSAKC